MLVDKLPYLRFELTPVRQQPLWSVLKKNGYLRKSQMAQMAWRAQKSYLQLTSALKNWPRPALETH